MSVFTDAQVYILISDFANTDAIGKLNILGAGVSLFGQPAPGVWPPVTVTVTVDLPAKHAGTDYALTVELHDVTLGKVVQIASESGHLQPLRVQQAVTVPAVNVPSNVKRPNDAMVQHIMVINFPTGLPLTPGSSYEWRAQIDGQSMNNWWRRFHALGPAAGPVIGGPMGPPTIPGVSPAGGPGSA